MTAFATPLADTAGLGELLAKSGYFTDAKSAAQAAVKVMAGAELGFGPIASMTGIYIVKGNVTLSANLMATVIQRHPEYDFHVKSLSNDECSIAFYRNGKELGISTFTLADARTAGLAGQDNWRRYPRNMLFARAMSNGAGFYVPGAFAGPIYTPDELGVDTDPETGALMPGPEATNGQTTLEPLQPTTPPPPGIEAVTGPPPEPPPDIEPDPAKAAAEDPNAQVDERQAALLRELLQRSTAPEAQQRMWLLACGVSLRANEDPVVTAGRLTVAQAHALMDLANTWSAKA